WSVLSGKPFPEPRLRGLTVGLLTTPPSVGDGSPRLESLAAEAHVARLEELGARVRPATIADPPANTWPLFFHEAARSHDATFPARADDYTENCRIRLEPDVDLYVSPVIGIDLPPEDCDELEVRLPFSAFLRPFNLLGWAGLAIGNLQLIAPRDEVVLAAGLAWEAG